MPGFVRICHFIGGTKEWINFNLWALTLISLSVFISCSKPYQPGEVTGGRSDITIHVANQSEKGYQLTFRQRLLREGKTAENWISFDRTIAPQSTTSKTIDSRFLTSRNEFVIDGIYLSQAGRNGKIYAVNCSRVPVKDGFEIVVNDRLVYIQYSINGKPYVYGPALFAAARFYQKNKTGNFSTIMWQEIGKNRDDSTGKDLNVNDIKLQGPVKSRKISGTHSRIEGGVLADAPHDHSESAKIAFPVEINLYSFR